MCLLGFSPSQKKTINLKGVFSRSCIAAAVVVDVVVVAALL
jgi:hypothetical protein